MLGGGGKGKVSGLLLPPSKAEPAKQEWSVRPYHP